MQEPKMAHCCMLGARELNGGMGRNFNHRRKCAVCTFADYAESLWTGWLGEKSVGWAKCRLAGQSIHWSYKTSGTQANSGWARHSEKVGWVNPMTFLGEKYSRRHRREKFSPLFCIIGMQDCKGNERTNAHISGANHACGSMWTGYPSSKVMEMAWDTDSRSVMVPVATNSPTLHRSSTSPMKLSPFIWYARRTRR